MDEGTCLIRFKHAFLALLSDEVTTALYAPPENYQEIMGDDGVSGACWFDQTADADLELKVMGPTPLWMDETATCGLVIQVVGSTTDDTQEAVDATASDILHKALALLFADPSVGLTDDSIQEFRALPVSWTYDSGATATGAHGARFNVAIEIMSRLKLEIT